MRIRKQHRRRGASLVEAAIVLPLFLLVVISFIDFGLGVFRYNKVAHSAREAAREASVRGSLSPPRKTAWGPDSLTIDGNEMRGQGQIQMANEHEEDVASSLRPHLNGLDMAQTTIELEWLDEDNHWGSRVKVTVRSGYRPILFSLVSDRQIPMESSCTVRIEH